MTARESKFKHNPTGANLYTEFEVCYIVILYYYFDNVLSNNGSCLAIQIELVAQHFSWKHK